MGFAILMALTYVANIYGLKRSLHSFRRIGGVSNQSSFEPEFLVARANANTFDLASRLSCTTLLVFVA